MKLQGIAILILIVVVLVQGLCAIAAEKDAIRIRKQVEHMEWLMRMKGWMPEGYSFDR